jgi:multiple sugar transport system substrate-binding protein
MSVRSILTGARGRSLLIGISLTCAAGCLAACGTGPSIATITIVTGTDTSVGRGNRPAAAGESGVYQQLVRWWNNNEQGPQHIRIKLDEVPGGATDTHSEMLAAAQGGRQFDIYNLDNEWTTEFADGGYILPLRRSQLPADDFRGRTAFLLEPLRSAEDASRQLYSVPFTTDVGLLYYNKNLVTSAQVDRLQSLPELITLAAGRQEPDEGYAGQFAPNEGLTVNALDAINNVTGPPAFSPRGTVRSQGSLRAGLELLVSEFSPASSAAHRAGAPSPAVQSAELTYSEPQAFAKFAAGQAVFMRNWPIYDQLLSRNQEPGAILATKVGVTALPFRSVLGGQNLAIAASSPDPAGALKVIQFLTSEAAETCLFAVGGFPATRRAAYSGSLPRVYQGVHHPLCGTEPDASASIGGMILTALGKAIQRPATPYYSEFTAVIQTCVGRLLQQAADGAATSAAVTDAVNAITVDLQAASTGRGTTAGCTQDPSGG